MTLQERPAPVNSQISQKIDLPRLSPGKNNLFSVCSIQIE
jgi:hypothetical protein